jgi:hypothetical protein
MKCEFHEITLKSDILLNCLNYIGKFSSYLIENKVHVHNTKQAVKAVWRNDLFLFIEAQDNDQYY